jgi:pimeloyl-ACP methyl ester carboxylesterase
MTTQQPAGAAAVPPFAATGTAGMPRRRLIIVASVVLVVLAGVVLAVTGKRAIRQAPGPGASRRGIALAAAAAAMSAALAACGSSPAKPAASASAATSASVVLAPVQVAHTQLGAVGYRALGSGPPLVLIMGYTGTMQDWDPRFVDTLARQFRVVIFDNAGVGRTQPLPAPLTIDAMADQTSAVIGTLGLGRANVLGWSMGGMIAQALAVRHPTQVRRLVLCATFPGTGAVPPSLAAIRALLSGVPQEIGAELFPADQSMAYEALEAGISSYPAAPPAPAATIAAQGRASGQWFGGTDPAGRQTAAISVPTLIADGTADRLDPVANDHALTRLIPRAQLVLYPDAGHAFLFQEGAPFTFVIGTFLTAPPKPQSLSRMRAQFLAGQAPLSLAGQTWDSELKALNSDATPAQVALIDQPFAAALAKLDEQLLNFRATGTAGAAITTFVHADENLIEDVLARAMQNSSTLGTWKTAITQDTRTGQDAAAALRKALGLPPAR